MTDISVAQWLGLTRPQVVKDTLNLPDAVIEDLPKFKPYILQGNKDLLTTNFTTEGREYLVWMEIRGTVLVCLRCGLRNGWLVGAG